tara:strand:- start:547 stop:726 length:180 start_codon:yes stop_codon:yes gene_type:complete
MIKIDKDNFVKIKLDNNKVKLVLNIKKDYNKSMQIEMLLDEDVVGEIIAKLISVKSKIL